MESINIIRDNSNSTISILLNLELSEYLRIVDKAYEQQGGIDGQRAPLKTQTAKRIRHQMISDFSSGGILPPVVIGVETKEELDLDNLTKDDLISFLEASMESGNDLISIIDGMQRTTAMREANINLEGSLDSRPVRVEFWISESTHQHLYRMLVLNTGQVPWSLRRHLEVVFNSLKKDIIRAIPECRLVEIDGNSKRSSSGEYNFSSVIEMFLVIGTRTERIETKEKLTSEFLKLDFIESSSKHELTDIFTKVLHMLYRFDKAISKYNLEPIEYGKFKQPYNLFSSQPALIGFSVSSAQYILGRPGRKLSKEEIDSNLDSYMSGFDTLIENISSFDRDKMIEFLSFETLNEVFENYTSGSNIGDAQRAYFKSAFNVIFEENFDVESMNICWRV
ncbi:hypothetical protein [Vibrio alginolyticus]|uniref:hypothetical protein n=1 Tax=Vibrio alginolyticus TaxID=663 RepID=UPI001044BF10|nr:hypothetical protein [Vibrio alginolyticus]EMC2463227.1 hypothetical protein [Vibrio alginolyticus]TDE43376.1 hypothetical protein E1093_22775 [Vibrio alginolyticus]HCE1787959.1 hypothetical protein [Vibrio parahaemolyticus]HCG5218620.1 hypothetical protein [Vibrio parahaemolyticus]